MNQRELLEAFAEALTLLIEEHSKDRYKCSGTDSVYNKCTLCVLAEKFTEWRYSESEEGESHG